MLSYTGVGEGREDGRIRRTQAYLCGPLWGREQGREIGIDEICGGRSSRMKGRQRGVGDLEVGYVLGADAYGAVKVGHQGGVGVVESSAAGTRLGAEVVKRVVVV